MRVATIDLGTNTVRLLVVDLAGDGTWRTVDQHQRVTRLGEGLALTGTLAPTPMKRTADVVAEYVERALAAGARQVRIVATSAVRDAANGRAFAAMVGRTTGRRVEIVSGEEEARLTVLGIRSGLGALPGSMVAFDIGGGSTEYIRAGDGEVVGAVSLRLGVVPLTERFPFTQGVDWHAYALLARHVAERLEREIPATLAEGRPDTLVGTAGTVTTLAALDLGLMEYDAARVQGHRLGRATVGVLLERLGALSVAERAALPCLEPGRADLIIPGIAIVLATMERFRTDTLVVSDWGLREGIVADLAMHRRAW